MFFIRDDTHSYTCTININIIDDLPKIINYFLTLFM